jgi:hypothetical protein
MTIIEKDIDVYVAFIEQAQHKLRHCHADRESYWETLIKKYEAILGAMQALRFYLMMTKEEQKE